MSLLATVIDEAQGAGSVPALLRRLKVLATRTGARDTLLPWVDRELGGYRNPNDVLPSYRGPFPVAPAGTYIGIGNSRMSGVLVSQVGFPEEAVEALFTHSLTEPIAELEAAAANKRMTFSWPGEIIAVYNSMIRRGEAGVASHFACLGVDFTISQPIYMGVLDQVRNIALDLALGLEQVAPSAGESDAGAATNTEARQYIEQHFHLEGMVVHSSNVSFGSEGVLAQKLNGSNSVESADPSS